ncbi:LysM peptidoglycan-binding domain-containing protein, partial [Fictibacillus sp. S7]|uniref:LysM peptidoglycan-binding domain-containing protein n=1 Tax=Fictibacillus sp. S7 TaxID=2212476 RepID=UPI0013E8F9F7
MRIHIVQKGDTLEKIADKYNIPLEELRRVNAGTSYGGVLERGSKVKIPSPEIPAGRGEKMKMPFKLPSKKEMPKKEMPVAPVQEIPVPAPPPPPPKPAPIPAPPKAAPIIPKAEPKFVPKAEPKMAPKAEPKMAPKAELKMPMKAGPIMSLKPALAKKDMPFNPLLPKKTYKESSMKSPKPLAPMSHKDFTAYMESSSSAHMKWAHHQPIHHQAPKMDFAPPVYVSPPAGLTHGKDGFGMGKQMHPFLAEESSSAMNHMYSGVPPMFEQPQGYTAPVYGGAGAGMPPFSAMPGQGQQVYPSYHGGGTLSMGSSQMGYGSMPQHGQMGSQHGMPGQQHGGQQYGSGQQMGQGMQGQHSSSGQQMDPGMPGQQHGGQHYGSGQQMGQGMMPGQQYGGQHYGSGQQMGQGMMPGQQYGGQQYGSGQQ